jgi:hypothetical protein
VHMPGRTHQSPVGETAGAGYGCFVSAVATELISVLLPAASTHSLARSRLISKVRVLTVSFLQKREGQNE